MMEDLNQTWQKLSPQISEERRRQKGDDIDEVQQKFTKLTNDIHNSKKHLLKKAGLKNCFLEQLNSFSDWITTTKTEVDIMKTNIESEDYSSRCEVKYTDRIA
jgi:hypothetical protein